MAKTTSTAPTMGIHHAVFMVLFSLSLCLVCGCQTTRPANAQKTAPLSAEINETNQKIEDLYHRLAVVQFMVDSHERILSDRDHTLKNSGLVKPESFDRNKKTSEPSVDSEATKGAVTEESISEGEQTNKATVNATGIEAVEPPIETTTVPAIEAEKKNESQVVEIDVEGKSPKDIYSQGFTALKAGDYSTAAALFKVLVSAYPNHDLADNAVYWTGEIFYDQKDYKEAIRIFNRLVETYPNGGKVPDALLKIGFSYHSMNDKPNAVKYLKKVVVEYPFTDPGSKAEAMLNKIERPQ